MPRQAKRDPVARERARRERAAAGPHSRPTTPAAEASVSPRRDAARTCAWCGTAIKTKARGRIPKWCSPACRQRAWEQTRAAASGRASVRVVERVVEVPIEREHTPRHGEWVGVLRELTAQLDAGRIYRRDLPDLSAALTDLLSAYHRHADARTTRP